MCCWHSSRIRCVSSKAVRHSSVTQGELLISQGRDVLASASGSLEDKQVASPSPLLGRRRSLRQATQRKLGKK